MTEPRFAAGQRVKLLKKSVVAPATGYTVAMVMPREGEAFEYRIKCVGENFVRVVAEHDLVEDGPGN